MASLDDAPPSWTHSDDNTLRSILEAGDGKVPWTEVTRRAFPDGRFTKQQVVERWKSLTKPKPLRGAWTRDEDEQVIRLVGIHGSEKWVQISQEMKTRTGKQCRERWHNHLDPTINKGEWTAEEDALIHSMYAKIGSRWAEMAKHLPGRPDNAIKNYWNASLVRQKRKRGDSISSMMNTVDLEGSPSTSNGQTMSRSASNTSLSGASPRFTPYVRSSPMTKSRSDSISQPSPFSPLRRDASTSSMQSQGSPTYPSPYQMPHAHHMGASLAGGGNGMVRSHSTSTFDLVSPGQNGTPLQRMQGHHHQQQNNGQHYDTPIQIVPRDLNKELFDQHDGYHHPSHQNAHHPRMQHHSAQQHAQVFHPLPNGTMARDTPPATPNRPIQLGRRTHSNSSPPVPSGLHYPRPPSPPASAQADLAAYPPTAFEIPSSASWNDLQAPPSGAMYEDGLGYDTALQPMAQLQIGDAYLGQSSQGYELDPAYNYGGEEYLASSSQATPAEYNAMDVNGATPGWQQAQHAADLYASPSSDQFSPFIHPQHGFVVDPAHGLQHTPSQQQLHQIQLNQRAAHQHALAQSHSSSSLRGPYSDGSYAQEATWDPTLVASVPLSAPPHLLEHGYVPSTPLAAASSNGAQYGYMDEVLPPSRPSEGMTRSDSAPNVLLGRSSSHQNLYTPSPMVNPAEMITPSRYAAGAMSHAAQDYGMYSLAEEDLAGNGPLSNRPNLAHMASSTATLVPSASGNKPPGMKRSMSYTHAKGLAGPIELGQENTMSSPLAQGSVTRAAIVDQDEDVFTRSQQTSTRPSLMSSPSSSALEQSPSRATGSSIRMQRAYTTGSPHASSGGPPPLYGSGGPFSPQNAQQQQQQMASYNTTPTQAPIAKSANFSQQQQDRQAFSPTASATSPKSATTPGSTTTSPNLRGKTLTHAKSGSWTQKHPTSDLMGVDANGRACLPGL